MSYEIPFTSIALGWRQKNASKPGQIKPKLSAWLDPTSGKEENMFHLDKLTLKKKKPCSGITVFPFLTQEVCLSKHTESTAAAGVMQTHTHALLSMSISRQFTTTLRSSQSASRAGRQSVSRPGQTGEQLAATFNSLRLPGLASTASDRHISAKCCMWQDGWTGCTQRGR